MYVLTVPIKFSAAQEEVLYLLMQQQQLVWKNLKGHKNYEASLHLKLHLPVFYIPNGYITISDVRGVACSNYHLTLQLFSALRSVSVPFRYFFCFLFFFAFMACNFIVLVHSQCSNQFYFQQGVVLRENTKNLLNTTCPAQNEWLMIIVTHLESKDLNISKSSNSCSWLMCWNPSQTYELRK